MAEAMGLKQPGTKEYELLQQRHNATQAKLAWYKVRLLFND